MGSSFSLLNQAHDILEAKNEMGINTLEIDIFDHMNRLNIDGFMGFSYHFKGENGPQLRLDVSYGLMNIYADSSTGFGYLLGSSFHVLIPIKFGL